MKTKDLIKQLQQLDGEKEIKIVYDYGVNISSICKGVINNKNNDVFTTYDDSIKDVSADFEIDADDLEKVNVLMIGG